MQLRITDETTTVELSGGTKYLLLFDRTGAPEARRGSR